MSLSSSLKDIFSRSAGSVAAAPVASIAGDAIKRALGPHIPADSALTNTAFMAHIRAVLAVAYTGRAGDRPDLPLRTSLHGGIATRDRMAAAAVAVKGAPLEMDACLGSWAMLAAVLIDEGQITVREIADRALAVASRALEEEKNLNGLLACIQLACRVKNEYAEQNQSSIAASLSRATALVCAEPLTAIQAQRHIAQLLEHKVVLGKSVDDALRQLGEAGAMAALDENDPVAALDFLQTNKSEALETNYSYLRPDARLRLLEQLLDGMEAPAPSDESLDTEFFYWYQRLAAYAPPQTAAAAAAMEERQRACVCRVLSGVLYEELMPGLNGNSTRARRIIRSLAPGQALLNEALEAVIDRHIAEFHPERALAIATDPQLLVMRGPVPPLTAAQKSALAEQFAATGQADRLRDLSVLAGDAPVADTEKDPAVIVHSLAPILSGAADHGARAFARFVRNISLDDAAAAQADMLAPVWDAFEHAAPRLQPLGKGRPANAPATAEGMHALSRAVAGYMGVAQTQLPVIMPAGWSAARMLNDIAAVNHVMSQAMSFADYSVRGSAIYAMANGDDGRTHPIGFSFLTARRVHSVVVDGMRVAKESLLSLPVISLDAAILKDTMAHGGEGIVRAAQEIAGIFNHDYFHHFTAAIINPYYAHVNGLTFGDTAYALLEKELENRRAADRNVFNVRSAATPASREYLYGRWNEYGQNDREWPVFGSPGADYEGHAMHMHNRLYREYMDDGPAGAALRRHIDDCADGVAALGERLAAAGKEPRAVAEMKFYYASYLTFNLRRLVPLDHPVMQHAESAIARMAIDPNQCRAIVRDITGVMRDTDYHKRLANVSAMAAVDADDPALDPVAAARWNGIRMSVNVLNMLYMDKYADAQAKALPALKEVLAVIHDDLTFMDSGGGLPAAERLLAHKQKEDSGLKEPPRLPRHDERRDRDARPAASL